MRYLVPLLCLLACPAFAQTAPAPAPEPAAAAPAPAPASPTVDWKSLGRPLDDDSKNMMDRYVYFDEGATDRNVGLGRPVMSQADIIDWLKEHLGQIMTLDGRRYSAQVTSMQTVFTPSGYADYAVYLRNAGMEKFLTDNNFKVVAYVEGDPAITGQGVRNLNDGQENMLPSYVYIWQATATLVLSYLDYKNDPPAGLFTEKDKRKIINRFPVNVRLELTRVPMKQDGHLIAINRIRFST